MTYLALTPLFVDFWLWNSQVAAFRVRSHLLVWDHCCPISDQRVFFCSRQVSEGNRFLPGSVGRRQVVVHTHNPVTGVRQKECLAAGGEDNKETCRTGGE